MFAEYRYNRIEFICPDNLPRKTQAHLRELAQEYTQRQIPPACLPVRVKRCLPGEGVAFQSVSLVDGVLTVQGQFVPESEEISPRMGTEQALPPLKELLERCQLDLERFCSLVFGCFDACRSHQVVLVAMDETKPDSHALTDQLLGWVYRLLPLAVRRQADYTTFFDHQGAAGYALGMVPKSRVLRQGNRLSVAVDEGYFTGSGCLIAGGKVVWTTSEKEPEEGDGQLFRQWLERLIRQFYTRPAQEVEGALENLEGIYEDFHRLIVRLPRDRRCQSRYYSALCWNRFYRESAELALPAEQERENFMTLLEFGSCPEVITAVDDRLETLDCEYESPAEEWLLVLLSRMIQLNCGGFTELRARELLAAFLSRDMEGAESGESSAVSARYFGILDGTHLSRQEQLGLLERVFFPQEFPVPPEIEELGIWEGVGTIRSEKEGIRRCSDWVSGYANVCSTGDELLTCGGTVLRELEGMERTRMASVLKSLLAAQEIRFHYARFEITPANLVECCRFILNLQENPNVPYGAELQTYYELLFQQLSKDMMEYLNRKYTLSTILALDTAFAGKPERRLGWQTVCALTLTQCEFIGAYPWENLKLRFGQEDEGILRRLWQVLELLDRMMANQEVRDMICHQTCRYLIHAVPEYMDEEWICREVRELPGLDTRGYYQELLALKRFLAQEERTLEELQEVAVAYRLSESALKDLMKLIYRLFRRKSLKGLSLLTVQGVYVVAGEKMKLSQLEVFRDICHVEGVNGLSELLDQWPSAPYPPGTPKWKHRPPRKGAYPWLTVNRRLMETLIAFSEDSRRLKEWLGNHPDDLWNLMESIDKLAPVGSVARKMGVEANRNLYRLWVQDQPLLKKVTSKSRKNRLLAE